MVINMLPLTNCSPSTYVIYKRFFLKISKLIPELKFYESILKLHDKYKWYFFIKDNLLVGTYKL